MLAALLICAAGFAAEVSAPDAPKATGLIILPESAVPQQASALVLPPGLVVPAAAPILAPDGAPAAAQPSVRTATPADLARLTARGSGSASAAAPGRQADEAIGSAFDGSRAPSAQDWEEVRRPSVFFAGGPRAPELPALAATARTLFQRLLPRLYRSVPVRSVYAPSKLGPGAAHYWTAEEGHVIEVTPAETDRQGQVKSVIGQPGNVVQQKIEQLVQYTHEYAHAVFDDAVGKDRNQDGISAFTSMTEGFAVTLERLFIERLLDNAPALGLSVRDVDDLRRIDVSRRRWLKEEDTAYSEGAPAWRRAHESQGDEGIVSLLSSLSVRRLMETPRADPVYQLSLGNEELLRAYLGHDAKSAWRPGLEAVSKAAAGAALFPDEARQASAVIEAAGQEGRRRVFDRVLSRADLFKTTAGDFWIVPAWLRGSDSVAAAFALADLNDSARSGLAAYLADAARSPGGLDRIFEKAGPSQRLTDVVSRAEKLHWKPADRAAWDAAIAAWLTKGTTGVRP